MLRLCYGFSNEMALDGDRRVEEGREVDSSEEQVVLTCVAHRGTEAYYYPFALAQKPIAVPLWAVGKRRKHRWGRPRANWLAFSLVVLTIYLILTCQMMACG